MGVRSFVQCFMYAFLAIVLVYFAFDLWRPSILLVGNVTVDVIGKGKDSGKAKQRPGGVPLAPFNMSSNIKHVTLLVPYAVCFVELSPEPSRAPCACPSGVVRRAPSLRTAEHTG
jgi:hypothetical protein